MRDLPPLFGPDDAAKWKKAAEDFQLAANETARAFAELAVVLDAFAQTLARLQAAKQQDVTVNCIASPKDTADEIVRRLRGMGATL